MRTQILYDMYAKLVSTFTWKRHGPLRLKMKDRMRQNSDTGKKKNGVPQKNRKMVEFELDCQR